MRADSKALVVFFVIACVPPWIGWSLLRFGVLPSHGPWQALYLTGWGASLGGLLATSVIEGGGGVKRLLAEAVRVAVPIRWWLFVALVPFLTNAAAVTVYDVISGKSIVIAFPALLGLISPATVITFFLGPFGEEFGWRGFLLPQLVRRSSAVAAVLIVGVIWAAWHWPLLYRDVIADPARQLLLTVGGITCMSVLIGAVYLSTRSVLLAMLLHWNINAMQEISGRVFPGLPDATSSHLLQWCGLGANVLVALLTIPVLIHIGRNVGSPDRNSGGDGRLPTNEAERRPHLAPTQAPARNSW
jgi:uncharacterized protein